MRVNEDLLKRLKAGEEKAFEDLYWTYSPQVYNFINSLLFDKSRRGFDTECLSENLGKA